jgi:hypothetical protein
MSMLHCVSIIDICLLFVVAAVYRYFLSFDILHIRHRLFYEVLAGVLAFLLFSLGNLMFPPFFIMVKKPYGTVFRIFVKIHACKKAENYEEVLLTELTKKVK